ncbi:MAG: hypothetical protein OEM05_08065 [Myxococcales bacterium]|nr:hypothetical protein [Myxococcales bacterium]
MRTIRGGILLAALLTGALATAASAEDPTIELKTTAEKQLQVKRSDGSVETVLVPAAIVVPGDVVAYTIEARNIGVENAESVVITDPIPEHTVYVPGSAEGDARILFSVDDGIRFEAPEALVVAAADGSSRAAIPADYTHIRWIFSEPLAPSAKRSVHFLTELQ